MFQRIRSFSIASTLALAGLCAGGANCNPQSDFQCSTDQDCLTQGDGGVCESNAFCSFPDESCEGGRRWHDRASSLAGICVGDEGLTATDSDPGSTTDTEGATEGAETSATAPTTDTPTTADPTEDPTNATTEDPTDPTTGDPTDPTMGDPTTGDPSTGGASSCDDLYGASTDYMLCAEAADSCSFSVTVAMSMNCDQVCTAGGGTCLGANLNEDPLCTSTGDTGCDNSAINDLICICSIP